MPVSLLEVVHDTSTAVVSSGMVFARCVGAWSAVLSSVSVASDLSLLDYFGDYSENNECSVSFRKNNFNKTSVGHTRKMHTYVLECSEFISDVRNKFRALRNYFFLQ